MVYLSRARWEQFIKPTLASLLLASVAHPALALDSNKAEDLDTIVVTSTEDATGAVDGDVNPLTVTGSKSPMLVTEVPQSVSILCRHELSLFEASTVSEGMRYTAGVTADVYGNDTDYDWLRVRGFQADQTGMYLDNTQNLSHAFGSFYTDPYILERAEVLRGPSSALYGGSNPGGIINYGSKRAGGHISEVTIGINDAGILLLDEPTTYLDMPYQIEILSLVRSLCDQRGLTIAMRDGAVVASGSPDTMVTPAMMQSVFALDCVIIDDPVHQTPHIIPR